MVWWVWLIVAVVLGIVELMSVTFVLLWIAVAALITAILSISMHNAWMQLAVFAIASSALYLSTRSLARKWRSRKTFSTHVETMVGETGVVATPGDPGTFATVRIRGELWSARAQGELQMGQTIRVVSVTSSILTVEPVEEVKL